MDATMLELAKRAFGSVMRHFLTVIFTALGLTAVVTDDELTNWGVALAGILLTVLWSIYQKYTAEKAVDKALDLPQTATREDLKRVINNG